MAKSKNTEPFHDTDDNGGAATSTATWSPDAIKTVRQLNNSFKPVEGKPYLWQALSALYVDPTRGGKQKGKAKMEPPTMMRVRDLSDGREYDVIMATIPQTRLEEGYPDNGHIGKCFRIVMHPVRKGERYRDYEVDEIDGTDSPHFVKPEVAVANAGKYGPREERKARGAK